jgi:CRP-like cAMP-binding protein
VDVGDTSADTATDLLGGRSDADRALLEAHGRRERFQPGDRLIRAGDVDPSLLVVLDGELIAVVGDGREQRILEVSPAGSVVGEIGFLDGLGRSVDVVASRSGELLRLTRDDFDRLGADHPALARDVLADLGRIMAGRLRHLTERVAKHL